MIIYLIIALFIGIGGFKAIQYECFNPFEPFVFGVYLVLILFWPISIVLGLLTLKYRL